MILLRTFLPYLLGAGALISGIYYVYDSGRDAKEAEIRQESQEVILQDRKKADEAIINSPRTPDGAREWLLRRNEGLRQ